MIAGYIRVSTGRQAAEGHSLGAQIAKIEAYAKFKGLEPVTFFADEGISAAKKDLDQRQAAWDMIRHLQDGDHVIVTALDRAWRKAADALQYASRWRDMGVTLHVLNCNVDTSTPLGRMFFTMLAAIAELESETIGERSRAGQLMAQAEGKHISRPPMGFRHGPDGKLVVFPEGLLCAQAIIQLKAMQVPIVQRLAALRAAGFTTPAGNAWTPERLKEATRRLTVEFPESISRVREALVDLGWTMAPELTLDGQLLYRDRDGNRLDPRALPPHYSPATALGEPPLTPGSGPSETP
jgi:DNA invertase Pin-like site-specific DNA recombinase